MVTPTLASTPEEPATVATKKRRDLVEEMNVYMYMLRSRHDTFLETSTRDAQYDMFPETSTSDDTFPETSTSGDQHEQVIDSDDQQFWSKVVTDITPAVRKIREHMARDGGRRKNHEVRDY